MKFGRSKNWNKRFHEFLKKTTIILSVFVVFLSSYLLVLPAITLDGDTSEIEPGIETIERVEETVDVIEENGDEKDDEGTDDETVIEQGKAVVSSSDNEEKDIEIKENEDTDFISDDPLPDVEPIETEESTDITDTDTEISSGQCKLICVS